MATLTVIDDEPDVADFIRDVALKAGYGASARYGVAGPELADLAGSDVLVLDLHMPGTDGIELLRQLAERECQAAILLVSGFDQAVLRSARGLACELGLHVVGTLHKPIRYRELYDLLMVLPQRRISERPHHPRLAIQPDELRAAILGGELRVHYQPQLELGGCTLAGVEALVRWQHPVHGLVEPKHFISLAEEHELIGDLTDVVLGEVIRQCRHWHGHGERVQVSVNMSARTMTHLGLPERLEGLIAGQGLHPDQFILEVTESAVMGELAKSLDILTRLRMKGFRLSIDDFGTGYSSMQQLYRIPFSELKVDQSFVMMADSDREARAIVEATIRLGHQLNMHVVAEGVETRASWEILSEFGCDIAQGFLVSRPMPGDQVLIWLHEHRRRVEARKGRGACGYAEAAAVPDGDEADLPPPVEPGGD